MTLTQLLETARLAQKDRDAAGLAAAAEQLLQRDPNNGDFMLMIPSSHGHGGSTNRKPQLIQRYVEAESTSALGFMLLYQAYLERNHLLEAMLSLTYALSIEPHNEDCRAWLKTHLAEIDSSFSHMRFNIMTTERVGHLACEIEPLIRARGPLTRSFSMFSCLAVALM